MQPAPIHPAEAPAVSVVLPVYGNAAELRAVHASLVAALDRLELTREFVFVDDASPDDSADVLAALSAEDSAVVVVTLPENAGQHRAVLAGMRAARGDRIVVMDADGQDPPEALPRLLGRLDDGGVHAVFAGRRGAYESRARLLTSRLFKRTLALVAGVPKDAGMYMAMDRRMASAVLELPDPPPFVVALVGLTGLPTASVPVIRKRRASGRSAYTSWKRLRTGLAAVGAVRAWKRAHPLGAVPAARIEAHNAGQRRYYESAEHPNLHPRESRYLRRQIDVAMAAARVHPAERVIEVGCGMGRYTLLLGDDLERLEACDLSPVLLERVAQAEADAGRLPPPLHTADVAAPPEELEGAFDVVCGFFMLHHLHDLTACFRGMRRMLAPGGRLVFVEPNPLNLLYYIQMLVSPGMSLSGDRGILKMRPRIVAAAMREAGLVPGPSRRFGFFPPGVADTAFGAWLERGLERVWLWRPLLPFHVFTATLPGDEPLPPLAAARSAVPWWVRLGVVGFVSGYVLDVFGGVFQADEAWFLYVLHRLQTGEVLFRDVWYLTFPLAVWVGSAFTRLFGTEVLVLKAVSTLCFTGTLLGCAAVARRLGATSDNRFVILAGMLAFAPPGIIGPGSLYTPMAFALLAATFAATLAWLDSGDDVETRQTGVLLFAAVLAGLTFSAKQDIGGYALIALTVMVVTAERASARRVVSRLAACWAVYTATVAVIVLPVVLTGSFGQLVTDAIISKTSYLTTAPLAYVGGLQWLHAAVFNPRSIWSVGDALRASAYILPLVALPLLLLAWVRARDARHGAVVAFTFAAMAGTFPRTDYGHLMGALPFVMMALIVGWHDIRPRLAPVLRTVLVVVTVGVVLLRLGFAVAELPHRYAGDPMVLGGGLPHFAYAPFRTSEVRDARLSAEALRSGAATRTVLVLSPRAGFLYLASGVKDPTRFDYPLTSVIPPAGQTLVTGMLDRGEIDAIWFDRLTYQIPGQTPLVIRDYMWRELHAGPEYPWGRLYTREVPPKTPVNAQRPRRGSDGVFEKSFGGAKGDRTPDLMAASHALSQLSYGPTSGCRLSGKRKYTSGARSAVKHARRPLDGGLRSSSAASISGDGRPLEARLEHRVAPPAAAARADDLGDDHAGEDERRARPARARPSTSPARASRTPRRTPAP